MPKARIKTDYGEIEIDFTNEADLKTKLESTDWLKINNVITSKMGQNFKRIEIIEEFKDLYIVDKNGLRLLRYPKDKSDQIRLSIFLAGRPLNQSEIFHAVGIKNPKAYTTAKDFQKIDDSIGMKSEGRKYVVEKIIPSIRAENK